MFFCKFPMNIYPAHKHLVLYYFLYRLQEHENKTVINIVAGTIKAYRKFDHVNSFSWIIYLIRYNLHQCRHCHHHLSLLMGTTLTNEGTLIIIQTC
ncbi:hypothetical protein M9H77_29924 [Catharanthus roseus]|uniref:Uncharacterized protein n=1 Tax=Catharanthus roseus TaxID=4058 RepID=A0ACB9ZVR4_CATRO|nr:hypothetical protein M9H77_29924 [Catharanthus roseus]